MKKLILSFLILPFIFYPSIAQNNYVIEGKNLKALINMGGDLFYNPNNFNSTFEIPKNSGKSTIFAGQLWIGGVDSATGQVLASAQTYRQSTRAWHEGPIANNFNGNYDRVYFATQSEVDSHLNNYQNSAYTVPQNFSDWPVSGDQNNGEPAELAPFSDVNQNGIYDPENGDHPRVRGNSAVYSVFNDIRDTVPFQGNPCCFGFDVESYVYDMSYVDEDLENTLLFNYEITNRSTRTYQDVYISMWMDPDLGNPADDFMGSDSANSIFFAYNADNDDEGPMGYGANPPAQGFIFLSHQMTKFMTYMNNFDSVNGNPNSDLHYFNYTRGLWKNGNSLTQGGDGTDPNNPNANFMYSGNGWTEEGEGNTPSDRRGFGSIGPFTLVPGEKLSFDFALLFFRDTTVDNFANRDSLISKSIDVADFYQSRILSIPQASVQQDLKIYPNPARDILNIDLSEELEFENTVYSLTSMNGQQMNISVRSSNSKVLSLDVSTVPNGIYILKVQDQKNMVTKRVIIE